MFYTELKSIPDHLVLTDFEKAFDLIPWLFIHKVLCILVLETTLSSG